MIGPRRHRATIAILAAAVMGISGFLVGQKVLQHASAAVPAGSPFGHVDSLKAVPGGVHTVGWAADPDTTAPLTVVVLSDGNKVTSVLADVPRPDVLAAYPKEGPDQGFSFTAAMPQGTHKICIEAVDVGPGADRQIGCQTMTLNYNPIGYVDSVTLQPGHVSVRGWTFDPDAPATVLNVALSIDGAVTTLKANASRPDVGKVYPSAGAAHGYIATLPLAEGTHVVCITAKNVAFGADRGFPCRTVTLDDRPTGHVDFVGQGPGGVRVSGWAFDIDSPTTALSLKVDIDGAVTVIGTGGPRPDVARVYPQAGPNHGFGVTVRTSPGSHKVCLTALNIGYGSDHFLGCRTLALNFNPAAGLTGLVVNRIGATVSGWASDPDTASPIHVVVYVDSQKKADVVANASGSAHAGHNFVATIASTSGLHTVCVVGVNVSYGTGNSPAACAKITLSLNPFGHLDGAVRANSSTGLYVKGWATDPDANGPITMSVNIDGAARDFTANLSRPDVASAYPAFGASHGLAVTIPATDGEHTICVTARNVGGGTADTALGCRVVNAVHPVPPSAPSAVTAVAGFGGATVNWTAPSSDGGAPWTSYTVTASPGGAHTSVGAGTTSATVTGLASKTNYTFAVVATNVAGSSAAGHSPAVTTQSSPPAQTTPAPISTSRYIRNVSGSSSADLSKMQSEGAADAKANPSGHGYLILLDIGGQDQADGGVVLSATTRFVSYGDLVKDLNAYVDGYHSQQKLSAPVTIALGTNNDMDVSSSSGATWAKGVVNPVSAHSAHYIGLTVAGANDIEPGFRGSFAQSKAWLVGYLGATKTPFVFNGSADGCSWTATNRGCNNGWSMGGLYYLAAGASPVRIVNLPQIYNTTMASQWKFISLTGVGQKSPKINFGGALTEWTACAQTGGCGSLTGNSAWQQLWNALQSQAALKVNSLPYSTDLRIDR